MAETADVADFGFGEGRAERVVEGVLSASAETGGAVADEDFFAGVFLFEEVVGGDSAESDGVAEDGGLGEIADGVGVFGGAVGVGGGDHAFEEIAGDALT